MALSLLPRLGHNKQHTSDIYFAEIRPQLYKRLAHHQQYGVRTGRSLAEHLDSATQLVLTLSPLAKLDERQTKVLLAAALVHDLNKLDEQERSVKHLARDSHFLKQQLELAGVLKLVNNAEDLEIIRRLIERHSAKHQTDGMLLFPEDPSIQKMAALLRAGDLIDIGLPEAERLRKVSLELSTALNQRCQLFIVRVSEHRGYLTSLLLQAVEELLQSKGLTLLCLYSDGALWLGSEWPQGDLFSELLAIVQTKITSVFGGNLDALVQASKDGIKIQDEALQHLSESLMPVFIAQLEKKRNTYKQDKIQQDIDKWQKKAGKDAVAKAQDAGLLPIQTQDDFVVAECLKAAYLSYRAANIDVNHAWQKIGQTIGLSHEQTQALESFDGQYGRPLFAVTASKGYEQALVAFQQSLDERRAMQKSEKAANSVDNSFALKAYIQRVLSWPTEHQVNWRELLHQYVQASSRSSLGATEENLSELSSADFPIGTKVQVFSNRLPGGKTSEPKRSASEVSTLAYKLLAVGGDLPQADSAGFPYYAHLMMPTASSPRLRKVFQLWIQEQASLNPGGPVSIEDHTLLNKLEVVFKANKVVGAVLPRENFVQNEAVIPMYWGKDTNATISFLKSLRLTLELATHLQLPFILSPNLEIETTTETFGQAYGIPAPLSQLLEQGVYKSLSDAERVLTRLRLIGQISSIVCNDFRKLDNCLFEMSKILSEGAILPIYSALLRWHLRTHDDDRYPFRNIVVNVAPLIHALSEVFPMSERTQLTPLLKEAAVLAAENHIRGRSFERTSLTDPFRFFLDGVREQKPHQDLEFLFARLIQGYHTRLDRLSEHGVGKTKREQLKSYFAVLRTLYEQVYQGRPERLLDDEKALIDAYLFFWNEAYHNLKQTQQEQSEVNEND
jgi:CRISPR-associated protein Csc3